MRTFSLTIGVLLAVTVLTFSASLSTEPSSDVRALTNAGGSAAQDSSQGGFGACCLDVAVCDPDITTEAECLALGGSA